MNTVRLRHLVGRRSGAVAIEYALILPMLLLFVIGIIDVGRLLWTFTTLSRAAEAAARCGAINLIDCGTAAAIQNRAVAEAWGMNIAASAFAVTTPACGVQVIGTYDFVFAIPALATATPLGTVTLKATACYPVMTSGGG
jgi:Flp pilus assembly protein TadG